MFKETSFAVFLLIASCANAQVVVPSTTYQYDKAGRVNGVQQAGRLSPTLQLDARGRLVKESLPNSSSWPPAAVEYEYAPQGGLSKVTGPRDLVTTFSRNGFGEVEKQVSPDTGVQDKTYDQAGNLKSLSKASGVVLNYSHDALNRLTRIDAGDDVVELTYDVGPNGVGKLSSMQNAAATTSWGYNAQGLLASRSESIAGNTLTTQYEYDAGRLSKIVYPSGRIVQFHYSAERVSGISVDGILRLSNVEYEETGIPLRWQMGGAGTYSRAIDTWGRIVEHTHDTGLRTITWDRLNQVESIRGSVAPVFKGDYQYDAQGRLKQVKEGADRQYSIAYDDNGNLTQVQSLDWTSTSTYAMAWPSNRVASNTKSGVTKTFAHDADGNRTAEGSRQFAWNNSGQLKSSTTSAGIASYSYNGLGQRVKKVQPSGDKRFYAYAEDGVTLLGEYQQAAGSVAAPSAINEVVYLGGTPVMVLRGGSVFFVQVDHLDTPRGIKNSSGALVWKWDSDPFGNGGPDESPTGLAAFEFNGRMPGQQYDVETGLFYNNARYYDSTTGRYVSSDPIGLAGGYNSYVYADGAPSNFFDETGEFAQIAWGAGVGAVIGGGLGAISAYTSGKDVWRGAWTGAVGGAVAGGLFAAGQVHAAGFFNGSIASNMGLGYGTAALGSVTEQVLASDCDDIDWNRARQAALGGAIGGAVLRPFTAANQPVVQWAPEGVTPSMASGTWVQTGAKSYTTKAMTGTVAGKYAYPYANSTEAVVSGSRLRYPSGGEKMKGLIGQRQIK